MLCSFGHFSGCRMVIGPAAASMLVRTRLRLEVGQGSVPPGLQSGGLVPGDLLSLQHSVEASRQLQDVLPPVNQSSVSNIRQKFELVFSYRATLGFIMLSQNLVE